MRYISFCEENFKSIYTSAVVNFPYYVTMISETFYFCKFTHVIKTAICLCEFTTVHEVSCNNYYYCQVHCK